MSDRDLPYGILRILFIKMILILGMWFLFVRGSHVEVSAASTARHFLSTPTQEGVSYHE